MRDKAQAVLQANKVKDLMRGQRMRLSPASFAAMQS